MNKTLYLHIGTHKTGTTCLQNFLYENEQSGKLHLCGFSYPEIKSSFKRERDNEIINGTFLICPFNSYYRKGIKIIKKAFKNNDSVILSDEMISLLSILNENIEDNLYRLKKICNKNNIDVRVILYLRRQDIFFESWLLQNIKDDTNACFSAQLKKLKVFLDYNNIITKFKKIFGNVIVRNYEKLIDADIISDFLRTVNLNITHQSTFLNNKLELNAAYIASLTNKLPILHKDKIKINYDLLSSGYTKLEHYGFLSVNERKMILNQYKECNYKLAQEYKILFDNDIKRKIKYSIDNKYIKDDLIQFIVAALKYKNQNNA